MSDRPAKMSDVRTKGHRISVRLPADMCRRLKAAARRNGGSESDLVRSAVERQLAVEEKALTAYERAKRAGLIRVVKGASRDLSANPKFFDGFGGS